MDGWRGAVNLALEKSERANKDNISIVNNTMVFYFILYIKKTTI